MGARAGPALRAAARCLPRREAGALPLLAQLLRLGAEMAGGDRAVCCVVLRALRELAPANKGALTQVRR